MTENASRDEPDWYVDRVARIEDCDLSFLRMQSIAPRTERHNPPSIWRYTASIRAAAGSESRDFGASINYERTSFGGWSEESSHTTRIRIFMPLEYRWKPFRKGRHVNEYYRDDGLPLSLLAMFYAEESNDRAARDFAIRQLRDEGKHGFVPTPEEWAKVTSNAENFSAYFSRWKSETLTSRKDFLRASTALKRAKEVAAVPPPHDATVSLASDGSRQRSNPNFDKNRRGLYLALKIASNTSKGVPSRESVKEAHDRLYFLLIEREKQRRLKTCANLEAQRRLPPLQGLGDFNKVLKDSGFAWLPHEIDLSRQKSFRL